MEVHEQKEVDMIQVALPDLLPGQSRQLQEQKSSTGENITQGMGPVCPQPWWDAQLLPYPQDETITLKEKQRATPPHTPLPP